MDYTILTPDHQRAMWEQSLGRLEEQHYGLEMECAFILAAIAETEKSVITADGAKQISEKRRIQASLARQIAEAKAQRDALSLSATEEPSGPRAVAAAAD